MLLIRVRGAGDLRKVSTWARQMQPHTIPLSPAMWFGGQDDRLIGLGYLGQAAFIWEVSVGQGPRCCACYLGQSSWGLGAPTPTGQLLRGAGGGGNECLLCGWEDLWLRMDRAAGHLGLGVNLSMGGACHPHDDGCPCWSPCQAETVISFTLWPGVFVPFYRH